MLLGFSGTRATTWQDSVSVSALSPGMRFLLHDLADLQVARVYLGENSLNLLIL